MISKFTCEKGIEEFGSGITLLRDKFLFIVHCVEDVLFVAVGRDVCPVMYT